MLKTTKYYRNAIQASLQGCIEYKDKLFITISWEEIRSGRISCINLEQIWKNTFEKDDEELEKEVTRNLVIALKTTRAEYLEGGHVDVKLEEMTSIFFMPVKVNQNGILSAQDDRYPWIPREFLEPMVEPQIAVGRVAVYDEFLENTTDARNQIDSWGEYLNYAVEMYEKVTRSKFEDDILVDTGIETDGKFYAFEDETINATFHIMQLYNHLLVNEETKLYSKITNGKIEATKSIKDVLSREKMIYHAGQMGGEYPISPSQREAISCFQEIKEGDILAVNGPPGTGKTTLLQSVVANMYVHAALSEKKAPVIVATSTNNQAVTNIIDSFGKINPIGLSNLESRWITGVHSFAVYFPSKGKIKEAQKKKYHYTTVNGGGFFEEVESEENRNCAEELFRTEFLSFFGTAYKNMMGFKKHIHDELKRVENERIACVELLNKIRQILGEKTYNEYVHELDDKIASLEEEIVYYVAETYRLKQNGEHLINRCAEWRTSYNGLPWIVRVLQFIPYFKKKVRNWSYQNVTYDELEFLKRGMNIEEIETIYHQLMSENDDEIKSANNKIHCLKNVKEDIIRKKQEIESMVERVKDIYDGFSRYELEMDEDAYFSELKIKKLNEFLDKVRYIEFWLAVHYYEALWLSKECEITEKQKGRTFEDVLDEMYSRLAMITPCMVMTCFMLPKQFYAYENNDKSHYYMYNYADLLIVDEAGQISTEIGSAAFALAKRAVVVGDEQQIPPVWGTSKALDIAMAISNGLIKDKQEYRMLESNGVNCSQSSIMKVASLSCAFEKYSKGLFLSEHRRCYDEIVEYCNDLVYGGNLEPLRGSCQDDTGNVLVEYLPAIGHKQISSLNSRRMGTSRNNPVEAQEIVDWVYKNYNLLSGLYERKAIEKNETFNRKNVLGIITPFKSQSALIKNMLKTQLPALENDIAVGTVHTFQGAERNIIIFSSVYGSADGCYFINANKNLMNVAVSRAKDSFLVFGDRECLNGGSKEAAGMLKHATKQNIEEYGM